MARVISHQTARVCLIKSIKGLEIAYVETEQGLGKHEAHDLKDEYSMVSMSESTGSYNDDLFDHLDGVSLDSHCRLFDSDSLFISHNDLLTTSTTLTSLVTSTTVISSQQWPHLCLLLTNDSLPIVMVAVGRVLDDLDFLTSHLSSTE